MSTPVEIINDALLDTHTNANNYNPETKGLRALNRVSDKINNEITKRAKSSYFWDFFRQDTVVWQSEYNFEVWEVFWDWDEYDVNIKEISKVFIKYDDDQENYIPCRDSSSVELEYDREYYAANQPKSDPFFIIQDRSVFVYPAPDEIATLWIKMEAIYTPPKIAYDSPESYLPLQPDKHDIYNLWMEWFIYKSQGKNKAAEAQEAKKEFDEELTRLIVYLKTRYNQPKSKTMWDLSPYQ